MRRAALPANCLFAWAKLNGVKFNNVNFEADITAECGTSKGAGLVSACDLNVEDDETVLICVPPDLILSQEQVYLYAAIDPQLKLVLDASAADAGFGRTARGIILMFLLIQITNGSHDSDSPIPFTSPHTDYVKFLPEMVLLPTFYTDEEKDLLFGTSLQAALDQKLLSLEKEFELLHQYTQDIPWCQKNWWIGDHAALELEDWKLVDALYRSRALDLPVTGPAIVPCIDMANHASGNGAVALYEIDEEGQAILQTRKGRALSGDEEITITYGDDKGACEMMFSYGFLEPQLTDAKVIFLDLDIPDDDPLRLAKKTANKAAPGVRISVDGDENLNWESGYVWWACVNEEDGLEFLMSQKNDGERKLEILWKGRRFDPSRLQVTLQDDPMWDIFRLRALVTIQERVSLQMSHLEGSEARFAESQRHPGVRSSVWSLIGQLRTLEGGLLSKFERDLEKKKTELLSHETVQSYLDAAHSDFEPGLAGDVTEDDFS